MLRRALAGDHDSAISGTRAVDADLRTLRGDGRAGDRPMTTAAPRLAVLIVDDDHVWGGPGDAPEAQQLLEDGAVLAGEILAEPRPGDITLFRCAPVGEGLERRKNFLVLRDYFLRRATSWRAQGFQIEIAGAAEDN